MEEPPIFVNPLPSSDPNQEEPEEIPTDETAVTEGSAIQPFIGFQSPGVYLPEMTTDPEWYPPPGLNREAPAKSVDPDKVPIPDQATVIRCLEDFGINFPHDNDRTIMAIDPDKFYISFVDGPPTSVSLPCTLPSQPEIYDTMGKYFKKGGMIFLNRKDASLEYTLEDLKELRNGLGHFVEMLEKKNKQSYGRFDIIKGDITP